MSDRVTPSDQVRVTVITTIRAAAPPAPESSVPPVPESSAPPVPEEDSVRDRPVRRRSVLLHLLLDAVIAGSSGAVVAWLLDLVVHRS
ncbi:hypothetical protein [Streptosporangium carneum]|uniref:Uncharacterized protein n=1 Tax=Streptosporangium carneum TaxID=47481 RepID=A0A9W6I720_9ACTN|nr:hypothetical protein [Streptosporangium carneum]GLK12907.1 hypothetical protein GCM10017600_63170 [Streptosporangium carneum]